MAKDDEITEDYVAELLKKDARESSSRYSAAGINAFLPQRPTFRAPKPNTRFLKNLIRDTDNHNAALKAKETEEASTRLGKLRGDSSKHNASGSVGDSVSRSRHVKEDHRSERRSVHENERTKHRHHSRDSGTESDYDERRRKSHRRHRDYSDEESYSTKTKGSRQQHQDSSPSDRDTRGHRHARRYDNRRHRSSPDRSRSRERTRHKSGRDRSRSRSRGDSREGRRSDRKDRGHRREGKDIDIAKTFEDARRRRNKRSRSRSRPSSRTRTGDKRMKTGSKRSRSPIDKDLPQQQQQQQQQQPTRSRTSQEREHQAESESDPLEAIIGPPPPPPPPKVIKRGRGAHKSTSGMDDRFAASYDPTTDIQLNSEEEDDWDQSLEALRDRQKWQQQGADRLRAAGFTETEVDSWQKGGTKNEQDVQWNTKGQGREWDRGKVVDSDGAVESAPEWGRLKGT